MRGVGAVASLADHAELIVAEGEQPEQPLIGAAYPGQR